MATIGYPFGDGTGLCWRRQFLDVRLVDVQPARDDPVLGEGLERGTDQNRTGLAQERVHDAGRHDDRVASLEGLEGHVGRVLGRSRAEHALALADDERLDAGVVVIAQTGGLVTDGDLADPAASAVGEVENRFRDPAAGVLADEEDSAHGQSVVHCVSKRFAASKTTAGG